MPDPQVPHSWCLPRRLPRPEASLFLTKPKPVRRPCRNGSTRLSGHSLTSVIARLQKSRPDRSHRRKQQRLKEISEIRAKWRRPDCSSKACSGHVGNRHPLADSLRQQGRCPEARRPLSSRCVVCPTRCRSDCLERTGVAIEMGACPPQCNAPTPALHVLSHRLTGPAVCCQVPSHGLDHSAGNGGSFQFSRSSSPRASRAAWPATAWRTVSAATYFTFSRA